MNYEKESKYLVSEKQFSELVDRKTLGCNHIEQINFYYDDNNYSLSKKNCTLRVRERQNNLQLQLKKTISINDMYRTSEEHSVDIIDVPSIIKIEQIQDYFGHTGDIFEKLANDFFLLGNLQTIRHHYKLKNHILFFDKNI